MASTSKEDSSESSVVGSIDSSSDNDETSNIKVRNPKFHQERLDSELRQSKRSITWKNENHPVKKKVHVVSSSERIVYKHGNEAPAKSEEGLMEKERQIIGLDSFESDEIKFDPSSDHIQLDEHVNWLNSSDKLTDLSEERLKSWLKIGTKKSTIEDETKFCDPKILSQMLKCKTMLDQINRKDIITARSACNPFEKIGRSIFQNRSAVKMANIDALLNYQFTDPRNENGESSVQDLLYYADVCSGDGGFSEFILWRKKWLAKGFGFTLRNNDDGNANKFVGGGKETFDVYYGESDDGNILDPRNIESLQRYVLSQTQLAGVHFMMADGGFTPAKKTNQEIACKRMYLCQCLAALSLVRDGGSFVLKLFDIFTSFSAALVYLMHRCFKQISIIKPNASRPASSERYLIGKFKKAECEAVRRHLFEVNQRMWDSGDTNSDVLELTPFEIMKEDRHFFDYLCNSNNVIGRNQVVHLMKTFAFYNDRNLIETRQEEIRRRCLQVWQLPIWQRRNEEKETVLNTFKRLMGNWYPEQCFLLAMDNLLTNKFDIPRVFEDCNDWYIVPINGNSRTFFMSRGGHNVCGFARDGEWKKLEDIVLEISADTLIYGEIVTEFIGDMGSQTSIYSLHIIDGMILGGIDIRHLSLPNRLKMCERFANALNKPSKMVNVAGKQIPTCPISCAFYKLKDFRQFFDQLHPHTLKDGTQRLGLNVPNTMGPNRYYLPNGLLFFNELNPNLMKAFSKTYQKIYFMDKLTGATFFQDQIQHPALLYSSFKTTFLHRLLWEWPCEGQLSTEMSETTRVNGLLYRVDFDEFIYRKSVP